MWLGGNGIGPTWGILGHMLRTFIILIILLLKLANALFSPSHQPNRARRIVLLTIMYIDLCTSYVDYV